MRKSIYLLFTWLFLCCICAGCGRAAKNSEELNIAIFHAPETMDPQLSQDTDSSFAIQFMSGSLFATNEEMELTPCLAKDYEVSEDGLTYTIHLKENLKWSDGSPLTAEDFVCAFQRLADPDVGSGSVFLITDSCVIKNAREVNAGELPVNMLGVSSPDHETLVVELEDPCPYFLKLLERESFSPCSVDFYHSMGDEYARNPQSILSSGPYILDKYEPLATQLHFTKNPYYAEADKITIPGITLQVIANQQQALMCFDTGSIDATKVNGDLLELAEGDEQLQVFPFAGEYYVYINQRDNPALQNKKIRQAFSMSIDRDSLVKNILRLGNTAVRRAVPPGFYTESDGRDFSEDGQRYEAFAGYDPARAKQLWKEGLSEMGVSSLHISFSYSSSQNNLMEAMAAQLEDNLPGLEVEKKIVSGKNLFQSISKGDYDLLATGWAADYPDPTAFLGLFVSGGGRVSYVNKEYDRLYNLTKDVEYTQNPPKRDELLHKVEDLLMEDVGVLPIFTQGSPWLVSDKVKGFQMTALGNMIIPALSKEVET